MLRSTVGETHVKTYPFYILNTDGSIREYRRVQGSIRVMMTGRPGIQRVITSGGSWYRGLLGGEYTLQTVVIFYESYPIHISLTQHAQDPKKITLKFRSARFLPSSFLQRPVRVCPMTFLPVDPSTKLLLWQSSCWFKHLPSTAMPGRPNNPSNTNGPN